MVSARPMATYVLNGHDFSRAENAHKGFWASAPEGARFRVFLGGYLLWRFAIDFMKPQPLVAGLNLIQWSCAAGIFFLIVGEMRMGKGKHEPVRA